MQRAVALARAMPLADWLGLVEAWVELARADLAVSRRPYARWRDRLAPVAGRDDRAAGARVARLTALASRLYPRRPTCLRRVIAQRALLQRRGCSAAIRFGVRHDGNALVGHAWIEIASAPIARERPVYQPLTPVHNTCPSPVA